MLRSITLKQFTDWQIFAQLEPFDEERADLRAAAIVQMVANVNRNTKKKPKPYTLDEMRLRFGDTPDEDRSKPKKSWQQMKEIAKMMAMGGKADFEKKVIP